MEEVEEIVTYISTVVIHYEITFYNDYTRKYPILKDFVYTYGTPFWTCYSDSLSLTLEAEQELRDYLTPKLSKLGRALE